MHTSLYMRRYYWPQALLFVATAIHCLRGAEDDLSGWTVVAQPPTTLAQECRRQSGGVWVIVGKPTGYLLSPVAIRNYHFHMEWRWPRDARPDSNSGVLVHVASGPAAGRPWPTCFQIQTKISRAGDILPMEGAAFAESTRRPSGARYSQVDRKQPSSELPLGEWNSCDIECRDGTIECSINGVKQNRVTHCIPEDGRIGLQLEGMPFELRNVRITPLR